MIHLKFAVVVKMVESNSEMETILLNRCGYTLLDASKDDELNLIFCAFSLAFAGRCLVICTDAEDDDGVNGTTSTQYFSINFTFLVALTSGFKYLSTDATAAAV